MGIRVGVRNMSTYGIEIFNSLGELVFSSDRRTVQILQTGHVSLPWGGSNTITFPPVSERPQIYIQTTGRTHVWAENIRYWDPFGSGGYLYDVYWWQMTPGIGVFEKNDDGLYYSIRISSRNVYLIDRVFGSSTPGQNSGEPFNDIPYVIFV